MENAERKPESDDPEQLARLLEIELMQKRATWQRASSQHQTFRMIALLFLVAVIAGAFAAYYFFVANASSPRADRTEPATATIPRSP